jgi:hypothetical protein
VILPSGAFYLIRSKHVCYSQDERAFARQGEHGPEWCKEHDEGAVEVFRTLHPPLKPRDHHWLTIPFDVWETEEDCKSGKPPVLQAEAQFGHHWHLEYANAGLGKKIISVIDSHYLGGRRGLLRDARWHSSNAVEDALGLLSHPQVKAIEVTL